MRLSTRGRYGVRAMLDLALRQGENPIVLKNIAKRQGIPEKYLEQLMASLRKAGLVESVRGAQGGYILAKPPSRIKVSHIIGVLEGSMAPVECINHPGICHRSSFCATRDVWVKVKEATTSVLESTTLQNLVEQQKEKENPKANMYYI